MEQKKTILITGASGFLGTWIADEVTKSGFQIVGIDLRAPLKPQIWDSFSTSSLEVTDFVQLLDRYTIDAVVHLAGGASVVASVKDPYSDFSSLLPATARLALYLAKAQPQARLFLFSSAAVYGNPLTLPIHESSPILPISPYGIHKATAETLLLHYSRMFDLKVTVLRVFSVYGPGLRKQLVWDVCQRAINAYKQAQTAITLFGTGMETRDFIYVKDVCRAVIMLMEQAERQPFEIYNLASGKDNTVREVAECLIHNLNFNLNIAFNGAVPTGDPVNWKADVSKLSTIHFSCRYTLNDGLHDIALWAKSLDME